MSEEKANKTRQELLDAISARGEASRHLKRARSIKIGPFGGMKVREAQAEYNAACKRVADAFDAWHQAVREHLEEDLKIEEEP